MTRMPIDASHLPVAEQRALREPAHVLGAIALAAWLLALMLTDFAHDALGIAGNAGPVSPGAFAIYETASGYVLGFVAAIAVALLAGLLRSTSDAESAAERNPWLRGLAALALFVVVLACVAGAAVHNAGGVTLLYDIAFVSGLVVVFAGVIPLHRHLYGRRDG